MIDFTLSRTFSDEPTISNNLLLVLQQIDMLFDTDKNAVLGDETFGSNYDKYLYTVGVSNYALKTKIQSDIEKLNLFEYTVNVEVIITEGTYRDIALIDITISGNYESEHKTYIIN